MALFEHFPYVNIQNLNLNWIIKVMKDAVAELETIQSNWEVIQKTANDAKTTADAAATKSENARITANGAMTKAVSAEDTAKAAKTQAEGAELTANAAQNTAVEAQAIANEANETAARAENTAGVAQATANTAKKTADGVDAKATTALENSTDAVSTANAAKTTADGIDAKANTALENSTNAVNTANAAKTTATNADSKIDALTKTVNTVGKTANDALSLAQTNEKDIASNDVDIAQIKKFITAPTADGSYQYGGYMSLAAGTVNYTIPASAESYVQLLTVTISDSIITALNQMETTTDGDGHALYRVNYVPKVWLVVNDVRTYIPAIATRTGSNTLTIAAIANTPYDSTDGSLNYILAAVGDLVGINQYANTPT